MDARRIIPAVRFRSSTHVEIWYGEHVPEPGQIVSSNGREWKVKSIEADGADGWICWLVPLDVPSRDPEAPALA